MDGCLRQGPREALWIGAGRTGETRFSLFYSAMPRQLSFFWLAIVFESALGVVAWLLGWALSQPALEKLRWSAGDAAFGTVATVPMLMAFFACLRWPVGPLRRIKQLSEEIIKPLFASRSIAELALVSLAAGLGEEMLFRGFLQACLVQWLPLWPAILSASIIFGLLHLITPTYAVLATLIGLYLGWLFVATDNLLAVVVAHALYDFLALVYLIRLGTAGVTAPPSPINGSPSTE